MRSEAPGPTRACTGARDTNFIIMASDDVAARMSQAATLGSVQYQKREIEKDCKLTGMARVYALIAISANQDHCGLFAAMH